MNAMQPSAFAMHPFAGYGGPYHGGMYYRRRRWHRY
jgi:hypothetical protein